MPEKRFGGEWTKGDSGVPILGIQTSASAAAASNGQYTPLQIDELGQLRVAAQVSIGANSSVNISQVGGSTTVTASAGIQRTQSIVSYDIKNIYSSGAAKVPTFLQISASASGSNVLIASAASTTYVILGYNLMSNGAVNAQLLSSATPMGGIVYMPTAGVGKVCPFSPVGWMMTTAGHSLNLNLSANIPVGGEIVYIAI